MTLEGQLFVYQPIGLQSLQFSLDVFCILNMTVTVYKFDQTGHRMTVYKSIYHGGGSQTLLINPSGLQPNIFFCSKASFQSSKYSSSVVLQPCPFLNAHKNYQIISKNFASCSDSTLSKILERMGKMLTGLQLFFRKVPFIFKLAVTFASFSLSRKTASFN